MGFSNVTILPGQPGLDAAIDGGGHQCFATLELGRVNNQATIGRKTGPLIRAGVCDGLNGFRLEVHDLQFELAIDAGNIRHPTPVRADGWGDVVGA